MMECDACGKAMGRSAKSCPHCGHVPLAYRLIPSWGVIFSVFVLLAVGYCGADLG
jgi:uncharacterized OB-fold protein